MITIYIKSKIYFFILLYHVHRKQRGYRDNHFILYITTKHNSIFVFVFFFVVFFVIIVTVFLSRYSNQTLFISLNLDDIQGILYALPPNTILLLLFLDSYLFFQFDQIRIQLYNFITKGSKCVVSFYESQICVKSGTKPSGGLPACSFIFFPSFLVFVFYSEPYQQCRSMKCPE